jgi:hypothetical protein
MRNKIWLNGWKNGLQWTLLPVFGKSLNFLYVTQSSTTNSPMLRCYKLCQKFKLIGIDEFINLINDRNFLQNGLKKFLTN